MSKNSWFRNRLRRHSSSLWPFKHAAPSEAAKTDSSSSSAGVRKEIFNVSNICSVVVSFALLVALLTKPYRLFVVDVMGWLSVMATTLPLFPSKCWFPRVLEMPRLQFLLTSLLSLVLKIVIHAWDSQPLWLVDWSLLPLLLACAVYHAIDALPFTPFVRMQVLDAIKQPTSSSSSSSNTAEATHLGVLASNVQMENTHCQTLLNAIYSREIDPDIVLILEANDKWIERLEPLQKSHPYTVLFPQSNYYGMALYSRLPLSDVKIKFLVKKDVPSIHALVRLRSGHTVNLHCLHPVPPGPTGFTYATPRDGELFLLSETIKNSPEPTIVCGDLNDVAWSRSTRLFVRNSGLVDPRVGRGFFNSWHAEYWFMRCSLDHFFHSLHWRLVDIRRLPYIGSDHFPMFLKLDLHFQRKENSPIHAEKQADTINREELKEVKETIAEARLQAVNGDAPTPQPVDIPDSASPAPSECQSEPGASTSTTAA